MFSEELNYCNTKIVISKWLLEITKKYNLSLESFINSIFILDLLNEKKILNKNNIHTYSLASLSLSSKLLSDYEPNLYELEEGPETDHELIFYYQQKILKEFDFQILFINEKIEIFSIIFYIFLESFKINYKKFNKIIKIINQKNKLKLIEIIENFEKNNILEINIELIKNFIYNFIRKKYTDYGIINKKYYTIKKQKNLEITDDILKNINFKNLESLGSGSYGKVYKFNYENKFYAIKVYKNSNIKNLGIPRSIVREICLQRKLNHPCLNKIRKIFFEEYKCFIITDFYETDLSELGLNLDIKNILYKILSCLEYLENNKIIHRDIKPENILYDKITKEVKLIDFGISTIYMKNILKEKAFTFSYKSPESIFSKNYDFKSDIWSLAITIIEIINEDNLINFEKDNNESFLKQIFSLFGTPEKEDMEILGIKTNYTKKSGNIIIKTEDFLLKDLLKNMLIYNPKKDFLQKIV